MNLAEIFSAELVHESQLTAKILALVPEASMDWQPHEKSMKLGALAAHVAEIFSWTVYTVLHDELDFAKLNYTPYVAKNGEDLVMYLKKNTVEALAAMQQASNESLKQPWRMRNGETIYFEMPRAQVMRGMVLNHIIHHRAQLGVYLRLLNIALPNIYGPTADSPTM